MGSWFVGRRLNGSKTALIRAPRGDVQTGSRACWTDNHNDYDPRDGIMFHNILRPWNGTEERREETHVFDAGSMVVGLSDHLR